MVYVEGIINATLRKYIDVPNRGSEFFDHHFLDQVGFRRKVKALSQIIEDEDLTTFKLLPKELHALYEVRNSMAHDQLRRTRLVVASLDEARMEVEVVGSTFLPVEYYVGRGRDRKRIPFDETMWDRLTEVQHSLWDLHDAFPEVPERDT